MAVNLSPVGGVAAQFFTNSGAVLTGGKLYTYAAGTTTPQAAYTTSQGNVPWTNPIVLDAAGRVPSGGEIWITDGLIYKFVLKDANDVLIATYDNITGINSNAVAYTNQQEIVTATAGQTVFNLGINYQPGTNSLSVFVDGVNQYGPSAQYSYVETDSNTVTFNAGLHVGAEVKFTTTQQQGAGAVDASQVSYDPPFTGSVATNVEAKLAQYVSVKDFGASPSNTHAQNKAALQTAIASANGMGGGVIIVNWDCPYGYDVNDLSTQPDFTGVTSLIQIFDYSQGSSYSGYPTAYDGAQIRVFLFTPQTTVAGQHDGNTQWLRGAWSPGYCISNDANLAPVGSPSRTAADNRRASIFFFNDGVGTWKIGQGTLSGASYTNDQLSNFTIAAFGNYGGGVVDGTSAMLIDRPTGNFGFNTDPGASYHFKSKIAGYGQGIFESLNANVDVTLRNLVGASEDVSIQNYSGVFRVATKGSLDFVVKGAAYSTKGPTSVTGTTYAVVDKDTDLIVAASGTCTITLPTASGCTGRVINVLTRNAQAVSSAASDVIGLTGGVAGTTILAATAGKWARLISDGGYWQINMAN